MAQRTMIKVFIEKHHGDPVVDKVRTIFKQYKPLYSIRRRCVSGDTELKAVFPFNLNNCEGCIESLRSLNLKVDASAVGES